MVEFHVTQPLDMCMTIVSQQGYILPEHVYGDSDVSDNPANTAPIGTGPYVFSDWKRGQEIILVKNDNY